MKKNQFVIKVPFFCGFYDSPLWNPDILYCELDDEETLNYLRQKYEDETLNEDDFDIDFKRYCEDCSEAFIEAFSNIEDCPDFIESIEKTVLTSPRYYNFKTDELYANVILAEDWRDKVRTFMDDNKDRLTKRIESEWSDRDGFWSFMNNKFSFWYEELQKDKPDERYISEIIAYMMKFSNKYIYSNLIEEALQDLPIKEYIICPEKGEYRE